MKYFNQLSNFLELITNIFPSVIFRYSLPFDRHDWVVDRDGTDVRYVIDFYKGAQPVGVIGRGPISIFLDVRPAIDSHQAIFDRLSVYYRQFMGRVPFAVQLPVGSAQPKVNK